MCLPLVILAGSHAQEGIWILWSVLILFAILSATQDIAIDAYTIELLEKHEMGVANGVRVTAYRIALIAAGGLVVAAAGLAGWGMVFVGGAVLMGLASVICSRAPLGDATTSPAQPRPPRPRPCRGVLRGCTSPRWCRRSAGDGARPPCWRFP